MKTCTRCARTLMLSEFHRDAQKRDGLRAACKVCTVQQQKNWKQDNPEKHRAKKRHYYAVHTERERATRLAYIAANPKKHRAHVAVQQALKTGRLSQQPCAICGAARAEAHHEDYDRRLDVRWLCRKHHAAMHVVA